MVKVAVLEAQTELGLKQRRSISPTTLSVGRVVRNLLDCIIIGCARVEQQIRQLEQQENLS